MSTHLQRLTDHGVLMVNGHFDYGNGYHGSVYLNPHRLFQHPSTIWRFAQDLIDAMPGDLVASVEVVSGPVMGGALLAHTMAGLMDGRRPLSHPASMFAPLSIVIVSPTEKPVARTVRHVIGFLLMSPVYPSADSFNNALFLQIQLVKYS